MLVSVQYIPSHHYIFLYPKNVELHSQKCQEWIADFYQIHLRNNEQDLNVQALQPPTCHQNTEAAKLR